MSHTYAIIVLSPRSYREIRQNLEDAGYRHAIGDDSDGEVLDMHGIVFIEGEEEEDGGEERAKGPG